VRRLKFAGLVALLGMLCAGGCDESEPVPPMPPLTAQGEPIVSAGDTPQRVLDMALKAHGGEGLLARWRCGRVKFHMRSDTIAPLHDMPATIEEVFQLPGHLKRVTITGQGKQQKTTTSILNREEGWEYLGDGSCRLLPGSSLESVLSPEHAFFYFCNLARLHAPGVQLSVGGVESINDRPAVVLHAEADGANPMDYYFDTVTTLLVRIVRHLPQPKGREYAVEIDLGDYHNIAGGPVPMRIIGHSGRRAMLDFTLLEVEFFDHLDASAFTPP
jgi:hypothetical protein